MELNGNKETGIESGIQNVQVNSGKDTIKQDKNSNEGDDEADSSLCQICKEPANSRCSGCSAVWYCGTDHQRQDWKAHKPICKIWEEVEDDKNGVHYVAKGDVKIGTQILKRKAILSHPRRLSDPEKRTLPGVVMVMPGQSFPPEIPTSDKAFACVGCYKPMFYDMCIIECEQDGRPGRGMMRNKCLICSWPLHSTNCQKLHEEECKILAANKLLWPNFVGVESIYLFLGVLRAVILKRDKSPDWKTLRKMPFKTGRPPSIWSDTHPTEKINEESMLDQNLKFVKHFIINLCNLGKVVTSHEVEIIYRIIWGNGFLANVGDYLDTLFGYIIFEGPKGRILPNSCQPNCEVFINPDTLAATFKTVCPVKAGEVFTIDYDSYSIACGNLKGLTMVSRPLQLQNHCWSDPCSCPRCSDPTENGTMFSAIRCQKTGCDGFLLPKDPNNIKQDSIWSCNNENCNVTETLAKLENGIIIFAGRELNNAKIRGDPKLIRETIRRFEKTVYHPNHYKILSGLMQDVMTSEVLAMISSPLTYLDAKSICKDRFILHTLYLEDVERIVAQLDILIPGCRNYSANYCSFRMYVAKYLLVASQMIAEIDKKSTPEMLREYLIGKVGVLVEIYKFVREVIDPMIKEGGNYAGICQKYRFTFNIHLKHLCVKIKGKGLLDFESLPNIYKEFLKIDL